MENWGEGSPVPFDLEVFCGVGNGVGSGAFRHVCQTQFQVPNGTAKLTFAGRTDSSIVRQFFLQHGIPITEENFRRFFDAYVFWLDHLLGQLVGAVLPGAHALIGRRAFIGAPHRLLGFRQVFRKVGDDQVCAGPLDRQ